MGEHRALGLGRLAEHDVVDGQIGQLWRGDSGIVRRMGLVLGDAKIGKTSKLEFFAETIGLETGGLAGTHLLEIKARLPTEEPGARWVTWIGQNLPKLVFLMLMSCPQSVAARQQSRHS